MQRPRVLSPVAKAMATARPFKGNKSAPGANPRLPMRNLYSVPPAYLGPSRRGRRRLAESRRRKESRIPTPA